MSKYIIEYTNLQGSGISPQKSIPPAVMKYTPCPNCVPIIRKKFLM